MATIWNPLYIIIKNQLKFQYNSVYHAMIFMFSIFCYFEKQMSNNIGDVFRGDNYVYMYTF